MITKKDISKGAIGNAHISRSAEIDPSKLKGDKVGSILIADRDGKYVARKIRGDASLLPNGEFRVASTAPAGQVTEEEVRGAGGLIGKDIKHGSTLVGERDGTPKEVNVGTGSNAIPQRDSSGNLKAETADQATNATTATNADDATLLNGNNMDYYRSVANHVAETETTSTDSNSNETTHKKTPHKVFEFDVPSDSGSYSAAGTSNSNYPIEFTHNCGYIPDVSVYYKSNNAQASDPWEEVDAEVQNTTTITKVQISAQNAQLKIVAK